MELKLKKERIYFVDTARGIYLYWMIIVHSLTQASIPRGHPLWLLQPGGWTTICFIMLSGFSVAFFFLDHPQNTASKNRILRRANEIAIIAYLSNLFFNSMRLVVESNFTLGNVFKIATFQYKWGISGILIPIALILYAAPLLIKLAYKISPWLLLTIAIIINAVVEITILYIPESIQENFFYQTCFADKAPYFDFPLIVFACLGMFSFSIGVLYKRGLLTQKVWLTYITPIGLIIYTLYKLFPHVAMITPDFVLFFIKFLCSVGLAFIISNLKVFLYLRNFLNGNTGYHNDHCDHRTFCFSVSDKRE